MIFNFIYIIFEALKVVRDGDRKHAPIKSNNNFTVLGFRPAVQYAYLMRYFIVFSCSITSISLECFLYSDLDKGACKRCTLTSRVIGSCKSWFSRGVDLNSLFVGAFSLSFFTCFCFCFGFVHFFLSLLCVNK